MIQIDSSNRHEADPVAREERVAQRKREDQRNALDRRFMDRVASLAGEARRQQAMPAEHPQGRDVARKVTIPSGSREQTPWTIMPAIRRGEQASGAILRAEILGTLFLDEQGSATRSDAGVMKGTEHLSRALPPKLSRVDLKTDPQESGEAEHGCEGAAMMMPSGQSTGQCTASSGLTLPRAVLEQMTSFAMLSERGGVPEFCIGLKQGFLGGATLRLQLIQKGAMRLRVATRDQDHFGPADLRRLVKELQSQGLPIVDSVLDVPL